MPAAGAALPSPTRESHGLRASLPRCPPAGRPRGFAAAPRHPPPSRPVPPGSSSLLCGDEEALEEGHAERQRAEPTAAARRHGARAATPRMRRPRRAGLKRARQARPLAASGARVAHAREGRGSARGWSGNREEQQEEGKCGLDIKNSLL